MVGQGSIPWALVGFVALFFVLLRYVSILLGLSTVENKKEVSMGKALIARTRIFISSALETIWAAGVSYAVGSLPA